MPRDPVPACDPDFGLAAWQQRKRRERDAAELDDWVHHDDES
jgi:hypothetical protein